MDASVIRPGATIGILGGGQLGKMSAMAAAELGYKTVIWSPPGDNPAFNVATESIEANYDDQWAFDEFVGLADVVTIEFENVPVSLLVLLSRLRPVRPGAEVLMVSQDRWKEKQLFRRLEIQHAPTIEVRSGLDESELSRRIEEMFYPAILKTSRDGYDGKGQVAINSADEVIPAWIGLGRKPCVLEERVEFVAEGSVMVARNSENHVVASPVFENMHSGGILRTTVWPFEIDVPSALLIRARQIAIKIASELKLEGILAVEFFFSKNEVYANELAPRPHNSFHGTIEASPASQFEQHIRAICNHNLANLTPRTSFRMINLIGDEIHAWPSILQSGSSLHIYGKTEVRPDRKMGHYTTLHPDRRIRADS